MHVQVRPFRAEDIEQALGLMRALAKFEGYFDAFRVTKEAIEDRGLGPSPDFGMLVVDADVRIVGIAVHYTLPWTYDLRPTLVLKELFVLPEFRSVGAGRRLFEGVVSVAQRIGAPRLVWQVLPDNAHAKKFYSSLCGRPEDKWESWKMDIPSGPGGILVDAGERH